MLLDQDIIKRIKLRKTVKIKVMVIQYRGTPPSLAVAKGSAHTHVFMFPSSEVVMKELLMMWACRP